VARLGQRIRAVEAKLVEMDEIGDGFLSEMVYDLRAALAGEAE
jgi:hypothetical protein